jgi:hypothetical protein
MDSAACLSMSHRTGRPAIFFAMVLGILTAGIFAFYGGLAYSADVGTVLNVPVCLLVGAGAGASLAGLMALIYGSQVPRAFCLVFAMGVASAVCMIGYGAFSTTIQPPWDFLDAKEKELQIVHDAFAIFLVALGLIVGAALRFIITEFGRHARRGAALGVLVALPIGPFIVGLVNADTLGAMNPWGLLIFMAFHALLAALGIGTVLALLGGMLDSRSRRLSRSHSLQNQRTQTQAERT